MLAQCFLELSMGEVVFAIGRSQIASFFSQKASFPNTEILYKLHHDRIETHCVDLLKMYNQMKSHRNSNKITRKCKLEHRYKIDCS